MDMGARVTAAACRVASNLSKQCVWSPGGAAALAPLSSRCAARRTRRRRPPPTKGHERAGGGRLLGIKVLGAFLGDVGWCSAQLVKRVRIALEPLDGIIQLRDAPSLDIAQQAQHCLI